MKRIVIIGGGITGLTAAYRLAEKSNAGGQPIKLKVLEASDRVGGIVRTSQRDDFRLEHGPDSFISEKPEAIRLAEDLGLDSHLIETNPNHRRSFIVRKGKLRSVPQGFHLLAPSRIWPFLTSDIFSFAGKLRMAADLILPRGETNGEADESLAQFVRRRLGREALERMAQPMVGGIYTADPDKLSLRATLPKFLEMEKHDRSIILSMWRQGRRRFVSEGAHQDTPDSNKSSISAVSGASGARYSLFLSLDRGMQMLVDRLYERISDFGLRNSDLGADPNFTVQLDTVVESLKVTPKIDNAGGKTEWQIQTKRGETLTADAVCLSLPAHSSASLLRTVDRQLAAELDAISYASTATINLAYERADIPHPLDGFGFVVPFIEKRSLLACTFSSVKFAGRAPKGRVLLRAFVGGALQPDKFALDEDELLSKVHKDLLDLMGISKAPLFTEVSKWEGSMPQYEVGHLQRVKRIEKRVSGVPGLALAGNAYSGAGLPDCIRSGEAAAASIYSSLLFGRQVDDNDHRNQEG